MKEFRKRSWHSVCDLVLCYKSLCRFGYVKASGLDDRKPRCIELIQPALRSSNPESFHVSPNHKNFCKRSLALLASFFSLIYSPIAYTADIEEDLIAANVQATVNVDTDTYTVNFRNISIIEFIRFASRITNLNFVFDEGDLQFAVTVISEEPVSARNVMSALSQVLRMHDLVLLEQGGNVLITKSRRVNQIPPIVSNDLPESQPGNAALITRVFRLKNANVNTIAGIIRPMCSDTALIEVAVETRQLIVTDLTTNVEQIASLLTSLDAPHTPLDVENYVVKNIPPQDLITMTQQILAPFTEGNPLILVPQNETNSIFVVSTPHLIERAMTVLEDLDIPAKSVVISRQSMTGKNIFLYRTVNRSVGELMRELAQVHKQLKNIGGPQTSLQIAIDGVQPIQDTNSLMFIADPETTNTLKDILSSLDTPSTGKTSFWIYKIQRAQQSQIEESLKLMVERLEASPRPDQDLVEAINSMRWIKETNSLIFTGTDSALKRLQEVVPTFDVSPYQARSGAQAQAKSTFLIYNPQHRPGEQLSSELKDIGKNLKESGLADPSFLQTLDSMRWVASTNSIVFTGDPQSIERINVILKSLDTPAPAIGTASQVFIYKPQFVSPDQIQNALNSLVPSLEATNSIADQNLAHAIQSIQWNSETQSFMVTTDATTIERLKGLLGSIDTAQASTGALAKGFFLYKLQYAHCDLVLEQLKSIAEKLPTKTLQNQNLIGAIHKIECIKPNNSLLITGTADAIEQIKTLISEFDTVGAPTGAQAFLIYKPKYLPPEEIEAALTDLAADLQASGLNDPALFQTLKTMRFVPQTNSLLFTGSQEGLDKVQNLLSGIDTSATLGAIQHIGNLTFFLYKIQYASADKLISSLKTFAQELKQTNVQDKQLADAINGVKWIKETNSLLFTGSNDTLERIEQLVKKFDIPSLAGPTPVARAATTFVIYNPRYLNGDELISILCDFMQNLMNSGVSDPGLFDAIDNLKWIPKTSSLLISGDQQSVDKVHQLLVKFDLPGKGAATPSIESIDNTSFLVYKLQYHPGDDIQTALKQVAASLGKGTGAPTALVDAINSLQWIQVTNSLLSSGQQDVLLKLKDLIQNLDVPLRQVFIEILAIETSLTNSQDFGLMWGGQAQYFNKATLGIGNFPTTLNSGQSGNPQPQTVFPGTLSGINATNTPMGGQVPFIQGFDLGVIGDIIMNKGRSFISLGALVDALQIDQDSTILLNPKIITQDNRQSTIFVGSNVPYTGAIVQNTAANTTSTANIEYRDVGVSLTITPILGDGDVITLDIVNDISQVISAPSSTNTTQLTGITTSHTHMETRVHVPDNYFVALSGMINDSKTHFKSSIPCLGGLPLIGAFFSENDRLANKQNVIIFVRPQIIKSYAQYKQITEHQEWLFKDNARLRVLKEQFDEGIDLVKVPENE
jgi:type III secretion protein C